MECLDRISLNISGTKFEVNNATLLKYPNTRLGRLAISVEKSKLSAFYFDRPATPFESILTFYQTGKLHLPPTVCPNVFKDELNFWEIDYEKMDQCCLLNFIRFMDDNRTKIEFRTRIDQRDDFEDTSPKSLRYRIWRIIDYREKSWAAKLFLMIGIAFVLLTVLTLALSTLPRYRRSLTVCEYSEYVLEGGDAEPETIDFFQKYDCSKLHTQASENDGEFHFMYHDDYDWEYDGNDDDDEHSTSSSNMTSNSSKEKDSNFSKEKDESSPNGKRAPKHTSTFPTVTLKYDIFYQIDYAATAFFTIELILRLCVCPSLVEYYKNLLNIIDTFVLAGTYIDIVISNLKSIYKFSTVLINFIDFIKILRVIRLLRYCQHLAAVQVLKFSVRQNAKDLLVLFFHIMIILLIFADIIYVAEDNTNIDSIPQGWWLGLITLTTVGYGDLSPRSLVGKITCSMCALCGIIMLSLLIPIFVDTFVSLYGIAQIRKTSEVNENEKKSNKVTEIQKIDLSRVNPGVYNKI